MAVLAKVYDANSLAPGKPAPGVRQGKPKKRKPVVHPTGETPGTYGMADKALAPPAGPAVGPATGPAATAAVAPKLSAYEKRRKGILDIINDPQFQQYNEAYTPNYEAARSQVENAFAQAMGEVGSRQSLGQGLANAMPGQINEAFSTAGAGIDQATANTAQAQTNAGVQSYMVPGADVAPVRAALATDQASQLAGVPSLSAGLQIQASQQRQQLALDRASSLADISTKEEDARASAADRKNQMGQYAEQQLIQEELSNQASANKKKKDAYKPGLHEVSTKRGELVANTYPGRAHQLQTDKKSEGGQAYHFVSSKVQALAGMGPHKQQSELARIIKDARKKYKGREQAISLAVYDVLGA